MVGVVLATAGVLVALYEWVAVRTGKPPTVTEVVKGLPVPVRVTVIAAAVLATVDHFGPGVVL